MNDFSNGGSSIYCESCHLKEFAKRCNHCNGPIGSGETVVKIAEKVFFHKEHFKCSACHNSISTEQEQGHEQFYHEKDGKYYCLNDYKQLFLPKCKTCDQYIGEPGTNEAAAYVSTPDGECYHEICFKCSECLSSIIDPHGNGSYHKDEKTGIIKCSDCIASKNICYSCKGGGGDTMVMISEDYKFHVNCFKCHVSDPL